MQVQLTFHLPGVALVDGGAILGLGRVEQLSFKAWQALDPAFSKSDRAYGEARPAFWSGEVEVPDDADQAKIIALLHKAAHQIHCAFLLEPRTPWLPTPSLSVLYFQVTARPDLYDAASGVTTRLIGPAEREWVVFGGPVSVVYDASALDDVARELDWIAPLDLDQSFPAVRVGIAVLERTARPDSWWDTDEYPRSVNEFVHCIASCESMLLPGNGKTDATLTDTFGRHAAVLTRASRDEMKASAAHWSDLYRLRSRILHGHIGLHDLDERQSKHLADARSLLRTAIKAAVILRIGANRAETLPSILAQAFSDLAACAELHERLDQGS